MRVLFFCFEYFHWVSSKFAYHPTMTQTSYKSFPSVFLVAMGWVCFRQPVWPPRLELQPMAELNGLGLTVFYLVYFKATPKNNRS